MLVNYGSLCVLLAVAGWLFPALRTPRVLVTLGCAVVAFSSLKNAAVVLLTKWATVPPATSGLWLALATIAVTWALQLRTRNYSWVDRLWSIVPVVYTANYFIVCFAAGFGFSLRLFAMTLLVTVWGARLTYNFARKGGYNFMDEDYRWAFCRSILPHPVAWELFALLFIAVYQHVLLFLITLPAKTAFDAFVAGGPRAGFRFTDLIATILFVGLLVMEVTADEQQWEFQTVKHRLIQKTGQHVSDLPRPYNLGFCTTGLFASSRHPNFFAEFMMWWAFYLFAVSASGEWVVGESILGTVLLTMLFQGSTRVTEYITAKKYPVYSEYQKRVSMLIPWTAAEDLDNLAK
ncbi:hypothetical protein BJ741DRAFT_623604 [Chytriomyces cf. hyalinus JEL632]|nr:hypothetical protein BJ741DRAFT_623604 [Chytriomyces cf. hyalinus JEL632]